MKDGAVVVMKSDTFEELKVIVNRNSEISDVKFSPGNYKILFSFFFFLFSYLFIFTFISLIRNWKIPGSGLS